MHSSIPVGDTIPQGIKVCKYYFNLENTLYLDITVLYWYNAHREENMTEGICLTEQIIRDAISKDNTYFVFPTHVAADSWSEKILDFIPAVATERFLSWDVFKGESVRSQQQDKQSVPSVMREIFAVYVIEENAKACKNNTPLFTGLINPDYSGEAQSFAPWIASLLPSLASWKKNFDRGTKSGQITADATDNDMLVLYDLYRDFLEKHSLFDPAWEQPPFEDRGNHYIIFYPEILNDFSEYRVLLENSPHITLVHLPENKPADCVVYENSRQELRETALFIRELVAKGYCSYKDICVSVPDLEVWEPYIKREFELYCIPAVYKWSKSLKAYGAGKLFSQIQQCLITEFSFASIKDLLLNKNLPWKNPKLHDSLIQFGIENSCLCSYKDKGTTVDVWKQAFKTSGGVSADVEQFYATLIAGLKRFATATTFEKVRNAYFQFRDELMYIEESSPETDLILGRCLSELGDLIDAEKSFPDVTVPNPFAFFISTIEEKEYLAQNDTVGVSVVPYRLAAVASAGCHIVLDASQESVTLVYKQLGFLPQSKRLALGLENVNPSNLFLQLYKEHSVLPARFSVSEKSFAGFSIPHNSLHACSPETDKEGAMDESSFSTQDFYRRENFVFKMQGNCPQDAFIPTETQLQGFSYWKNHGKKEKEETTINLSPYAQLLRERLFAKGDESYLKISQSQLRAFFTCPRSWFFERILRLEEPDTEVLLMKNTRMGIIFHSIIHAFLEPLKNTKTPIPSPEDTEYGSDLSSQNKAVLKTCVKTVLENSEVNHIAKSLLLAQEAEIYETMERFFVSFTGEFKDHVVVALEEKLSCAAVDGEGNPIGTDARYEGILDCILCSSEDDIVIVDFKTGRTPGTWDCLPDENGQLDDFQMALYTILFESVKGVEVDKACFFSINNCCSTEVFGFGNVPRHKEADDQPYFDAALTACGEYAKKFADVLENLHEPVELDMSYGKCMDCGWKSICRTTYVVAGERV